MKKIIAFILSLMVSLIFGVFMFTILGKNRQYNVGTATELINNTGNISDIDTKVGEFINDEGEFQIKIGIENSIQRSINYSLSIINNYQQVEFKLDNSEDITMKNIDFTVDNDSKEYTIIMNKDIFNFENNDLIIVLRRDIDMHVKDNELLETSNTVTYRFNVVNDSQKGIYMEHNINTNKYHDLEYVDITSNDTVFKLSYGVQKDNIIKTKANQRILTNIQLGGSKISEKYIIWGYLNSNKISINENEYCVFEIPNGKEIKTKIELEAPMEKGEYELELFCAVVPEGGIDMDYIHEYNVMSCNKYTWIVE